jgi:hypothetical protein
LQNWQELLQQRKTRLLAPPPTRLLLLPPLLLLLLSEGLPAQSDEVDMGMSYAELGLYGRLRKITRCGPVAMFRQACGLWREVATPQQVADKVRHGAVEWYELLQQQQGRAADYNISMSHATVAASAAGMVSGLLAK